MSLNVVLLPGDGIGPEVTAEAARLLGRIGELYRHAFRLITCPVGGAAIEQEVIIQPTGGPEIITDTPMRLW